MARSALYRCYDGGGDLLYVGISADPERRVAGHRTAAPWAASLARTEYQWFDSREEAADAEVEAIATEGPIWNRSLNRDRLTPGHRPLRRHRVVVSASSEEKKEIERAAAEMGVGASTFLRLKALEAARDE